MKTGVHLNDSFGSRRSKRFFRVVGPGRFSSLERPSVWAKHPFHWRRARILGVRTINIRNGAWRIALQLGELGSGWRSRPGLFIRHRSLTTGSGHHRQMGGRRQCLASSAGHPVDPGDSVRRRRSDAEEVTRRRCGSCGLRAVFRPGRHGLASCDVH